MDALVPTADGKVLRVVLNRPGDRSTYRLNIVKDRDDEDHPDVRPDGFDPILSEAEFIFKVECLEFDCPKVKVCPPEQIREIDIDYLAKDYSSFRQLMLDRMALIMPEWTERNSADIGIVLVELLAYVADHLSYQQDAIATETYLDTARQRISVRRHARLVDYFMHDGCNARMWVQVKVNKDILGLDDQHPALPEGTQLLTLIEGQPSRLPKGSELRDRALVVFETKGDMHGRNVQNLYFEHNEMEFYTWGAKECCLPRGATKATLIGKYPGLQQGDVLIFKEILGPKTGQPEDADPSHRHAVCLIKIEQGMDPIGGVFSSSFGSKEITNIEWSEEDALPFPLCISSLRLDEHGGKTPLERVSIALGNIVLADHGMTISSEGQSGAIEQLGSKLKSTLSRLNLTEKDIEFIGEIPGPRLVKAPDEKRDRCENNIPAPIRSRFNPGLKKRPMTQATRISDNVTSARTRLESNPEGALPAIIVFDDSGIVWHPKLDLLSSIKATEDFNSFVVEVNNEGHAFLRFGDGIFGALPKEGTKLYATYRVGNGVLGNVGPDSIIHILSDDPRIEGVQNPMAALGGIEPESMNSVRMRAPSAFRTQERAVTPEDYAAIAERDAEVQKATATFRWTGSWHTVFLIVDRKGGKDVDRPFEKKIRDLVEPFRMAGQDIEVAGPAYVSLEIEMDVCLKPDYFQNFVREALMQRFSNQRLPDGRLGAFHPDNFSFGEPVYLSRLYKAALEVEGVESVQIKTFQRQGMPSHRAIDEGMLVLDKIEVARLDNDPNFPEHGVFSLNIQGGK